MKHIIDIFLQLGMVVERNPCVPYLGTQGPLRDTPVYYYCWINSTYCKAMAEGRKRVAICAMKRKPSILRLSRTNFSTSKLPNPN